jgi:alkaline phosphatase
VYPLRPIGDLPYDVASAPSEYDNASHGNHEGLIPLSSETHSGEEVSIYAIGPSSWKVHGTVKNTFIFELMKDAFGARNF